MSNGKDRELPLDQPSSFDSKGNRKKIHPTSVNGFFQKRREFVKFILILFFLSLPWIKIGGHPLLLLDIQNRVFSVFGILFRAHDIPIIVFILLLFTVTIGWLTTLFGRVWCGWACPQTVFIEFIFRRIETWIEGDAITRRKMDTLPFSLDRGLKLFAKWFLFLIVSIVITHSGLALFVGAEQLPVLLRSSPSEHLFFFLATWILTFIILFDFGYLREQFCIVMCPYGKIQSVFQDMNSLTVTYAEKRGEPRKGTESATGAYGDCIGCYKCVQVCPTGVDIRRGSNQLECIACTACADACDSVMEKLNKPKGLIGYKRLSELPLSFRDRFLKGRPLAYEIFFIILITGLSFILMNRKNYSVEFFKVRGAPYNQIENQIFSNTFHIEVNNESDKIQTFEIRLKDETLKNSLKLIIPNNPVTLDPVEIKQIPLSIEFEKKILSMGKTKIFLEILITESETNLKQITTSEVTLIGPY